MRHAHHPEITTRCPAAEGADVYIRSKLSKRSNSPSCDTSPAPAPPSHLDGNLPPENLPRMGRTQLRTAPSKSSPKRGEPQTGQPQTEPVPPGTGLVAPHGQAGNSRLIKKGALPAWGSAFRGSSHLAQVFQVSEGFAKSERKSGGNRSGAVRGEGGAAGQEDAADIHIKRGRLIERPARS